MARIVSEEKRQNQLQLKDFIAHTDIRQNIVNWYDFKEDGKVLEIGLQDGKITEFLASKLRSVVSIEVDKEQYTLAKELFSTKENVELKNINLVDYKDNFNFANSEKFDYVVAVTSMDRIALFTKQNDKLEALTLLINISQSLLKETGKLIVAVDNKFAIRNFSGATYSLEENSFDSITGKNNNITLYSKKELKECIKNTKMPYCKFYYPFPDYKLPNIIFSDEYLPNENHTKMKYLIYYMPQDTLVFDEMEALREIAKENMIDFFSNSYLIEIANDDKHFSNVKFASFNNFRKRENKLITKLYDGYVKKERIYDEGKTHIASIKENLEVLKQCNFDILDEVKEDVVHSKYVTYENLNAVLVKLIQKGNSQEALQVIRNWYQYLSEKFESLKINEIENTVFETFQVAINSELKKDMTFLSYGLFDLIFENIFVTLNEQNDFDSFLVYDQEWSQKNLPIEFILYRALNNLFYYNSIVSKVLDKQKIYEEFKITPYISYFEELERKIQESLVDQEIVNMYEMTYSSLATLEGLTSSIMMLQDEALTSKRNYQNLLSQVEKTNANWDKILNEANEQINELSMKLEKKHPVKTKLKKWMEK